MVQIKKRMLWALPILALVLTLTACPPPGGSHGNGIDFESYASNAAVWVRNETSQNLVAFKGTILPSTLIGGVEAHANNHAFKYDPAIFATTSDFPLIFITEEQYLDNKNNLESLNNTPFTRVYAFYNQSGDNSTVYTISGDLGGNYTLKINNTTSMNVELRQNGINGPTIGYVSAGMLNQVLHLESGDYDIFPVFKKYYAVRDQIVSVTPKRDNGNAKYYSFGLGDGQAEVTFNVSSFLTGTTRTTGSAYLMVDNQSLSGIKVFQGATELKTSTGMATINSGGQRTYEIKMAAIDGANDKFASTASIAAYTIGPSGDAIAITGTTTLSIDRIYKVTVTGDVNDEGLTVVCADNNNPDTEEDEGAIDMSDFDN
jgi:hypothetical protein